MPNRDSSNWMLSQAIEALARAERMQRQMFQLNVASGQREPRWEPPIDVFETAAEILVFVSLPGVDPDHVETTIEDGDLVIVGRRTLPPELRQAVIHRLELPQGRFERRIALPTGSYTVSRFASNGCLVFSLEKRA